MANDILKFKKKDKSPLYPFTHFKAVVDENGRDLDTTVKVIKEDVQCIKVKNYFDAQLDSSSGLYKVIINGPEENDKDTRYEILSVSAKNLNADDDYIVIDSNGVKGSFGDVLSLADGADDVILYQTGGDKTKSSALYYGYDRVDFIHSKFERHCKVLQISDFISSLPAKDASGTTTFGWNGSSGNGRLQIRISSIMEVYPDLYMTLNNVQWDNKLCEVSQKNSVLSSKKGSSANVFIDGFNNIEGETFAKYSQCVNYLKQQSFKIVLKLAEPVITSIEDMGIELKSFEFERKKGESAWVEFSDPQGNTSGCVELAYLSTNDYLYTKDQIDEKFYNKSQIDASLAEIAEKKDVFYAIYGQTTYNEIREALSEGKSVIVKYDWDCGYIYFHLSSDNSDSGIIYFATRLAETIIIKEKYIHSGLCYCSINDGDVWSDLSSGSQYENVTYSELIEKRELCSLEPGKFYRINDYITTTSQENTQSAEHRFDIIVRADSDNKLNERAFAIQHSSSDNDYFANSKLEAWKIWYCVDNDTERFGWALNKIFHSSEAFIRDSTKDSGSGIMKFYAWVSEETGNVEYTLSELPKIGDMAYDDTFAEDWTVTDVAIGKGVIYRMIDEWGNDCPYDFKNIQFKRYKITACTKSPDLEGLYSIADAHEITADTSTTYWCYTFSMINLFEDCIDDVTVYQTKYPSDEGFAYLTHDNVFKEYIDTDYDEGVQLMMLPNNVMVTDTDICSIEDDYSYGEFYGFYSNTFGNDFRYNTFGNNCNNNTFGNSCYSNTFGNSCYSNTFGNDCGNNTFGNDCGNNTFGNDCWNNTFGNDCYYNTFGNNCGSNTFGNNCYGNTFGNNCGSNTFGNNCYGNTFGNFFYQNTFGNYCNSNTFGNNCNNIIINKDYIYYIIVENGNQYITITSTQTTSSANMLRNFTIAQGVNNTSTRKTISHNTVNQTFKTIYQPANSQTVSV